MMDPIEDSLRSLLKFLIFAGIILDLLSIKWRSLANGIIYLECFTRWIVTFIPNYGSYWHDDISYSMMFALIWLLFCNDDGKQIICTTLTLAWHMFFALSVAYNKPSNFLIILSNSGLVILYLILQIVSGTIIINASKVHDNVS